MSETQRVGPTQRHSPATTGSVDAPAQQPIAGGGPARQEEAGRAHPLPRGHTLILANRLPWPLDDGWKVRTFHVMRGVARRARATVLVFHSAAEPAGIEAARAALGPTIRLLTVEPPPAYRPLSVLRGLVTRYPVHTWNQESAVMRRQVGRIVAEDAVDVVVAESTFMARYLDLVPSGVPHLIDTHNIDSVTFSRYVRALGPGPRRAYAAITARKLAAFEAATFRSADGVWVCSDVERELVGEMAPGTRVWTVPNGVDTTFFDPAPDHAPAADRILFFGRLDYYPNVDGLAWFAREILPRIRRERPAAELHVVGAGAGREVQALASAIEGIRLIGRVPDVRDALRDAAVVVAPLRVGGGTRLKILEALSMGRAVVSTTIGAEGLDVKDGAHLLLADEPATVASAVVSLLADDALAGRLGEGGRALVREHYDWSRVDDLVAASLADVVAPESG